MNVAIVPATRKKLIECRLLKISEVSDCLNLSRSSIYGLMDAGLLAYVKLGKSRRIPLSAVQKLVREGTVTGEKLIEV
ncbi:MAG: DNA-binding protein [Planctomycetota bacterium]|nr:MAG: DNA-binding protein [Planctomycetota bacterium]